MKKILFSFLFMLCAPVLARGNLFFEISVQNNTPNTCYLARMKLIQGTMRDTFEGMIFKIAPGELMKFPRLIEYGSYGPKVSLWYDCEGGSKIELESEKTLWRTDNQVKGQIVSAVSMDATFTSTPADWYSATPGKINWTLL